MADTTTHLEAATLVETYRDGESSPASWLNPQNARLNDSQYSELDWTSAKNSIPRLEFTDFGFSIPPGATIESINIRYAVEVTNNDVPEDVFRDRHIALIIGGVSKIDDTDDPDWFDYNVGTNIYTRSSAAGGPVNIPKTVFTHELSPAGWNHPDLTVADVNASNFGVLWSAYNDTTNTTSAESILRVYYVELEIVYSSLPEFILNVYDGTAWNGYPLKRWDETAWVPVLKSQVRRWDGSQWVST